MRRPTRSIPLARTQWMIPASPGDLTPMELLISWLERNGEAYHASKRKVDMLEKLLEEMGTKGVYGLSISSLRSQIVRLKKLVQQKAEGGNCNSRDVNLYYDRLRHLLFDEDERAKMREQAKNRERGKSSVDLSGKSRHTRAREKVTHETEETRNEDANETDDKTEAGSEVTQIPATNLQHVAPRDPGLDVDEIRRRVELVSARLQLLKQGADQETIDSILPLPLG